MMINDILWPDTGRSLLRYSEASGKGSAPACGTASSQPSDTAAACSDQFQSLTGLTPYF